MPRTSSASSMRMRYSTVQVYATARLARTDGMVRWSGDAPEGDEDCGAQPRSDPCGCSGPALDGLVPEAARVREGAPTWVKLGSPREVREVARLEAPTGVPRVL